MFNLGFSEVLVIFAVALIFIGPDKLPELAQKLGRILWEIRHASEEFRKELAIPDFKKEAAEWQRNVHKEIQETLTLPDSSIEQKSNTQPTTAATQNQVAPRGTITDASASNEEENDKDTSTPS